jgi:hypothetical protein
MCPLKKWDIKQNYVSNEKKYFELTLIPNTVSLLKMYNESQLNDLTGASFKLTNKIV